MRRHVLSVAVLVVGISGLAFAAKTMPSFDKVDTNHDGKISKQEASKIEGVDFTKWDANQDGYISREEWNKMTKSHQ